MKTWHDWDLPSAERHWQRANELNPNYPDALAMYSHFLMFMGRPEEAKVQIKRAIELDPFNVVIQSFYAIGLYCARRYEDAIVQARKALALQSDAPVAIAALYLSLRELKRYEEAYAIDKQFFAADFPEVWHIVEEAYRKSGYGGAWGKAADVQAKYYGKGQSAINIADTYLLGG